jgi:hypothetical protein
MVEFTGNIWTYPADVVIITTNGTVTKKGECVMGRGCAKEAKDLFPGLPKALGDKIKKEGNHPYLFELATHTPRSNTVAYTSAEEDLPAFPEAGTQSYQRVTLVTFPVKHNWYERADLTLIRTSALQLRSTSCPVLGVGTEDAHGMRSDPFF